MKLSIVILILTCFYSNLVAQNLLIEDSEQHLAVVGTSLKMIPPADFEKGQNFYGFQHAKTHSSIIVFQVNNEFSKQTAGFTKTHLAKEKIIVKEQKRFMVNNDSAIYISAIQEWENNVFLKQILAIGNKDRTVVINAACLNSFPEMHEVLKNALSTSFLHTERPKSATGLLDFVLNPNDTRLSLVEKSFDGLNALVFVNANIDGNPFLIATKSVTTIQDNHKTYAQESIKTLGIITPSQTIEFKEITLDGLPGFESITKGTDKNGDIAFLYRAIVYTPGNYYYSFAGKTLGEDYAENVNRFRKLVHTFKRK